MAKNDEPLAPGQIVLVDWRDGDSSGEANKLRPAVVVGVWALLAPESRSVLLVPLTSDLTATVAPYFLTVEPTAENGSAKVSYALAHLTTAASRKRIAKITISKVTPQQLVQIRHLSAQCLGVR